MLVCLVALAAGFCWAFGLSFVHLIDAGSGWVVTATLMGLVNAWAARRIVSSLRPGRAVLIVIGWALGGILSARTTAYDVVTGWATIALIGGPSTAIACWTNALPERLSMVTVSLGWVIACAGGAALSAAIGPSVARTLSSTIGGELSWAVAWGTGGLMAGSLAAAIMAWRLRPRR